MKYNTCIVCEFYTVNTVNINFLNKSVERAFFGVYIFIRVENARRTECRFYNNRVEIRFPNVYVKNAGTPCQLRADSSGPGTE